MRGADSRGLFVAVAVLLVCAACGDDGGGSTSTATQAVTTTEAPTSTTEAPTTTTEAPTTTAAPSTTAVPTTTTAAAGGSSLIVFNRYLSAESVQIFTIDPATGEEAQLSGDIPIAYMPVWSPDRTRIAFWTAGDEEYVWVMDADGGNPTRVTDFSSAVPDWLGDDALVFNSDSGGEEVDTPDLYSVRLADPTVRTQLVDSDPTLDFRPRVSPDGASILFTSNREDPNMDVWVLDVATGDVTNLTAGQGGVEMNADWSPDGTLIVYARGLGGDFDLWVMNADGSDPRPLVEGPGNQDSPSWSPDGTRIVYTSDADTMDLWVVDADGANPRRLSSGPGVDLFPNWS